MNEEREQQILNFFGVSDDTQLDAMIHSEDSEENREAFKQLEKNNAVKQEQSLENSNKTIQDYEWKRKKEWAETLDVENWSTNEHDLLMQNKDYRQKLYKKAMHDYAYLDSTEHHIVEMLNGIGNKDKNVVMTVDEARQYAKEKGIEWNAKDKETISKYELDKQLERETLRRSLEQEIAEYAQYKDYTKLDTLSRLGSTLSGGVGAVELAATIGIGFLTGPGAIAGIAKLSGTALKAKSAVAAANALRRMQLARNVINSQQAIRNEIQVANKTVQISKLAKINRTINNQTKIIEAAQKEMESSNFLTKLAYDSMRFGKTGLPGSRASLATVAIPMAIDSVLSDIPRELVHLGYSHNINSTEYGTKEMLRDLMLAGSVGFVLPFGAESIKLGGQLLGKGIGKSSSAIWNLGTNITNKVYGDIAEKNAEAALKNLPIQSEKEINQLLTDIQISLQKNGSLSPSQVQTVQNLQNVNLTSEETMNKLTDLITLFSTGEQGVTIPARTEWMTTAPGIYDIVKNVAEKGGSIDDIWNEIKNSGLKISYSGSWNNGKPSNDIFKEFKNKIQNLYLDSKIKFKDEQGYLGNKAAMGITNADSEYFLKNLYIAHLLPDTEVGKLAKQNLKEYHEHLQNVSNQIKKLNERYNEIVRINKEKDTIAAQQLYEDVTGKEYKKPKYSAISIDMQDQLYPLLHSEIWGKNNGTISEAITDIVYEMLPKEIRDKYYASHAFLNELKVQESLIGHIASENLAKQKEAREFLNSINDQLYSLINGENSIFYKRSSKTYTNTGNAITVEFIDLLPFSKGTSALTGEAKATRSARLEYMGKQIDNIIENNNNLINAEETYQKLLPESDEIISSPEAKGMLDVTAAEREVMSQRSDVTVATTIKSDNAKVERFNTARLELEKSMQNTSVMDLFSKMLESFQKATSAKRRLANAYTINFMNKLNKIDTILQENFTPVRNVLIEKLKTSEMFNEILEKPYFGKISETSAIWKIPKYRNEFKRLVKESINETINESGKYTEIFGNKFDQILDDSLTSFDNYLKENMEEGMKNILTPHAYNAEVNTKEEIAKEIVARTQREQTIDNILQPFFEQLSYEAMDYQTENYREMIRLMKSTELFDKYPGQIDEIVLGQITMSPVITEGSSLSAEARAQIYSEWTQFQAALDRSDSAAIRDNIIPQEIAKNKDFVPLKTYALDPDNAPVIKEAIFDRIRFVNGEMSEEEAKLYNRTSNTRAARVAKAYLDTAAGLKQMLFNSGSNKNKIVNLLDSSKIKSTSLYLSLNKTSGKYANAINKYVTSSDNKIKGITQSLTKFINSMSNSREDLAINNMALDFFEKLDLDKQFKNNRSFSLNEVRDALVSEEGLEGYIEKQLQQRLKNTKITDPALIQGEKEKVMLEIKKACDIISDEFFGTPGENIGFINRVRGDVSHVQDPLSSSFRARYVEDIQPKFFYKNIDYEKQDIKLFGYDNMKSMFENNFRAAKNAYAVLENFGSEPIQHMTMLKELAREYAETIAPQKLGMEKAKLIKNKLNSPTWERSVDFNLHNVCGTYTVPANMFQKWMQIIVRTASAPMLMNAGFRSLTDYNYQMQSLITMGLASEGDLSARARIVQQALTKFTKDKDLANQIYITEMVRDETLYSMLYNSSLGTGDILADGLKDAKGVKAIMQILRNPNMSKTEKAEILSRRYTDLMLNKFAFIGPMTRYNRENAAITTMKAIGSFSSVSYKQMPERLQQTLTRFGVSEYEWDNILSKHVVTNSKNYIYEMSEKAVQHEMSDYNMFFPELVDKISDEQLTKFMKDQHLVITDTSKARYRQFLKDKASLLINSSADEMTSIPSSRIQGLMSLHNLPNTGASFFSNTLLQFQSFGAAINYYQWGRRLASMQTPDQTFNHLICSFAGHPTTTLTMAQFIAESALAEFFVGEILREVKGTNRRLVNDRKEFQTEALVEKIADSVGGAVGLGNMLVQTILSKFMKSTGQGGGLSIPALPSLSTILQKVERPINAATKKSTAKNRGKAIAGAIGEDIADILGFPNNPFCHSAWSLIIGDTWKEWQQGDRAKAVKTQRLHRGYTPSLTRHIAEEVGILEPNETTLYSKFAE